MTLSEFWDALERVFGSVLGRSLVADLYLPGLRATAQEALDAGRAPDEVWEALVRESGRGEEARWAHRRPLKKGGH
ncbi:MAG: DUF3046 domain-containing protein [Actinomyces sp.]|nr:DUF3046 domain-containing protein [Actinomyces sp.]MCI1641235.1 DUF3046 domain-containing protein [Actinomyces sp.]MCI1662544.1 DUF3046 domain-containing protein [Actinomyces sp.]MCI1786856.1 DUF3046 domain-containing protein [Actinomyces sp.]MCI1829002.1 DUF3046 domain-containing protein [Actinomyces sp.]MCI1867260.1 DUF3046 domain-containing protein [Actinomyces sp.]